MKQFKRFRFTDLLIGMVFTLLFISLGVIFSINFRPLYYLDINLLKIQDSSGLSKEVILNNYNTLIDYCSPFFKGVLSFPTLTASKGGLQHFAEVKDIFVAFYYLVAISLPICIYIVIYKARKRDTSYLLTSSITVLIIPTIVGLLLALNFDTTFRIFHELFFDNDYWLFDPDTDPVITILPDTFFLHCALLIIIIVFLGSLILFLFSHNKKKRNSIRHRKNKGLRF